MQPHNLDTIASRVAWMYYVADMTQGAIAAELEIPQAKVHRLLVRAKKMGVVQITIDPIVKECIELEQTIQHTFGLTMVCVAPALPASAIEHGLFDALGRRPSVDNPSRCAIEHGLFDALGRMGALFLQNQLKKNSYTTVGFGHGRTMSALVVHYIHTSTTNTRFVSLLGGLTQKFAANPYDVIHKFAEKTNADAFLIPAPLFADTEEDKNLMMQQSMIKKVDEIIADVGLALFGIGCIDDTSAAYIDKSSADLGAIVQTFAEQHVCAELLGCFFDVDGNRVHTALDGRLMGANINTLHSAKKIAIAGGVNKRGAIVAALRTGLLNGLITDEDTARHLVLHADTGK